ncbi:hypothetical protein [Lysobacter gummosus]|uniref:hypothetical protein n=1 Tax=Lysobacter gummosus TaxID=262324 RepID=UPI003634A582
MKAAIWVLDSFRALPRYLLVLAAVSALALLARAAVPSFLRSARPRLAARGRTRGRCAIGCPGRPVGRSRAKTPRIRRQRRF